MQYAIETIKLYKKFSPTKSPSFKDVFKFFGKRGDFIVACNEVDLRVREGELFGLVGPNGAGKTTLLKILSTIILPDSGKVMVNGFDVSRQDDKVRACIGLVTSETRSFYVRLSGRENLRFFASLYGLFSSSADKKIEELSELLEIKDKLDIMYQEYSSGIKQRFALARGLLNDAPILLVDEPTKSLDPSSAKTLRDFIRKKLVEQKKKTVIFTSHSLNEIQNLADTIAIMARGRLKASGPFDELRQKMSMPNASIDEDFDYYIKEKL
jgi:ABC-2 type transport system ATP-binding protein